MSQYFAIPDDERQVLDDTRPDRQVHTGLYVKLEPRHAIAGRSLIVRASIVEIEGLIHVRGLPEGTGDATKIEPLYIEIVARKIIAGKGACISVDGPQAVISHDVGSKALNGQSPGAPGTAGSNGSNGFDAGRIRLVAHTLEGKLELRANGSAGGNAQGGGDGAEGPAGHQGAANQVPGRGGLGGPAGPAGQPGCGGRGGDIFVSVVQLDDPSQLDCSALGGAAGSPGAHGRPGEGGPGGTGGWPEEIFTQPCVV